MRPLAKIGMEMLERLGLINNKKKEIYSTKTIDTIGWDFAMEPKDT